MINYPLPYWYQFTISGPTLPDFYWNVKSQEERIKKICEDLWKLIQVYKMLVDAINDHEGRIEVLETKVRELEARIDDIVSQINSLNQNVTNIENSVSAIEQQITNLINSLPTQIRNIVNQILDSEEFLQKLTTLVNQIVADLLTNKMDKVPSAKSGNIPIFSDGGLLDSGFKFVSSTIIDEREYSNGDTAPRSQVPNGWAMNHLFSYYLDGNNPILNNSTNYAFDKTIGITTPDLQLTINNHSYNVDLIKMFCFDSRFNPCHLIAFSKETSNGKSIPVLLHAEVRFWQLSDTNANITSLNWEVMNNTIEASSEQEALALSSSLPSAIVYIPEV